MSKKIGTGDIFYLKIENENLYVFGRVLFDVNSQFNKIIKKTELSEEYFPILAGFYQGYQLVEMYDGIYENIDDFTEKMEKFIKNTELIKKMGDKSKEMSKEFDITEIFKKLEKNLT